MIFCEQNFEIPIELYTLRWVNMFEIQPEEHGI
jgi:hypothetical protein